MKRFIFKSLAILLAIGGSALASPSARAEVITSWTPPATPPGIDPVELECPNGDRSDLKARGSSYFTWRKWDDGIIPYILSDLPGILSDQIRSAMREWEIGTCVRFIPKTDEHTKWIKFEKKDGPGCQTELYGAPIDGEMIVNLDMPNLGQSIVSNGLYKACGSDGTAAHELGHALGLIHEHQRADRDDFVTVNWEYVKRVQSTTSRRITVRQPPYHSTTTASCCTRTRGSVTAVESSRGLLAIWAASTH